MYQTAYIWHDGQCNVRVGLEVKFCDFRSFARSQFHLVAVCVTSV